MTAAHGGLRATCFQGASRSTVHGVRGRGPWAMVGSDLKGVGPGSRNGGRCKCNGRAYTTPLPATDRSRSRHTLRPCYVVGTVSGPAWPSSSAIARRMHGHRGQEELVVGRPLPAARCSRYCAVLLHSRTGPEAGLGKLEVRYPRNRRSGWPEDGIVLSWNATSIASCG